MAKSGLTHIDVGPELTRTEWESEESHALINGAAFPGSPVERQLFYRNDLHEWYIYNGSAWEPLQATAAIETHRTTAVHVADQPPDVHDNAKHSPDYEEQGVAATQIETHRTTAVHVADQPPDVHDNAKHSPAFAEAADLSAHIAAEAAGVHGSTAANTPNTVVHRDANGRSSVAAPISSGQIAIKANVDAVQTNLDSHAALTTGVHGVGAGTIAEVADIAVDANLSAAAQDAVVKRHERSHPIASIDDHYSTDTPGQMLKANAGGLPTDATNTDTEVADAVTKKHAQNTDTDLSPAHKDVATGVHGVAASTVESATGSQAKVDAHAALTTNVHGISSNPLYSIASKTYYLAATTGNDANDGETALTAFKTWSKVNSMIPVFVDHYYTIFIIENYTGNIELSNRIIGGYVQIRGDLEATPYRVITGSVKYKGIVGGIFTRFLDITVQGQVFGCIASPVWFESAWRYTFHSCVFSGAVGSGGAYQLQTSIASAASCNFGAAHTDCIYAINSRLFSATNTGNGTQYGLAAYGAATIGKSSTQPTGTVANESTSSGGVIR